MRIRFRLLVLVLAVLVPAFLVAGAGMVYVYSTAQRANRESLREVAHALALVLDREMAKRETTLRTLADAPSLDAGDLQTFYALAQRVAPPDSAIILSNAAGRILFNTRAPFGTPDAGGVSVVMPLRAEYGPARTIVSNMYRAPIGAQDSFSIQIPVQRAERVIYFLEMSVAVQRLQSVFAEQQLPDNWIGAIVDRNGIIVARNRSAAHFVGSHIHPSFFSLIRSTREGFTNGNALSGERVRAFFSEAPHSDWHFIVSVPRREAMESAAGAAALIGSFSLLILAVSIAVAMRMSRHIVRSVEQLTSSAECLGKTKAVTPLRSGIHEFDAVGDAMVRASAELKTTRADLEQRVADAVAVAERSQRALLQGQKLEALGRLTGGIAHDFNNVLQTLTTGLQVCLMSLRTEREQNLLRTCLRAVQRGTELARQLMAFGRVQDARMETVKLGAQLRAVLPLLSGTLPSNIRFEAKIDDAWNVTVDPLQFELALLNLTMNARDAMPDGGVITLEARNEVLAAPVGELPAGEYVRIAVTDTGMGMSEEVSSRALDPFYTTKQVGQGSGMGLPQAYGFARQSGGMLLLSSRPGTGTEVIFYLPRAMQEAGSSQLDANNTQPPQRAAGAILFVEDDPLVRETVVPALAAAGMDVTVAESGEQAVDLLQAGRFDLVFSDIVMPGTVSGIDLAHMVRERSPDTHIVLASGYSERRVDLPGVRLLAKPYSMSDVVAVLNSTLMGMPSP